MKDTLFYRWLSRSPNYVSAFGLWTGLKLLLSLERQKLPNHSDNTRSVTVPGLPHPLTLRDCRGDRAIFWQCFVARQYRLDRFPQTRRLMQAYEQAVGAGMRPVIIDGGGNIGLGAIWFAEAFPQAVVVSVEPDKRNFDILQRNTQPYGERIVPVRGAVTAQGGRFVIDNPQAGPSSFRTRPAREDEKVDALDGYTIPDLVALGGGDAPFIVKLDIEGGQKPLFEGQTDWLANPHLVIMELDDWLFPWGGTSRPFFRAISSYPYDYLLAGENIFCFRDASVGTSV